MSLLPDTCFFVFFRWERLLRKLLIQNGRGWGSRRTFCLWRISARVMASLLATPGPSGIHKDWLLQRMSAVHLCRPSVPAITEMVNHAHLFVLPSTPSLMVDWVFYWMLHDWRYVLAKREFKLASFRFLFSLQAALPSDPITDNNIHMSVLLTFHSAH